MVILTKDGDRMGVITDAINEHAFTDELSEALSALIEANEYHDDWVFQFSHWLPVIADIYAKYRGSKNSVIEALGLDSHDNWPDGRAQVCYQGGKVTYRCGKIQERSRCKENEKESASE